MNVTNDENIKESPEDDVSEFSEELQELLKRTKEDE